MTNGNEPGQRGSDYRAARIGAAAALTGVLTLLFLIDALSESYSGPSEVSQVVIVTLIAGLLSVDLPDILRRR